MKKIVVSLFSVVLIALVVGCAFGAKLSEQSTPLTSLNTTQTSPARSISSTEDYSQYNAHTAPIFSMVNHNRKVVVVFWITTCGFCRAELERLNNLVTSGQVAADSILAISVGEDQNLVTNVTRERGYRFRVALDPRNALATKFNVRGTPTIVFINEDKTVEWMSVGASTELPARLLEFIN